MTENNNPLANYTKSLLDPFLTSVPQPKIYDGKVLRSAGVRFRTTGELTIDGGVTYIVLSPALTAPLTWYTATTATVPSEDSFDHIGTQAAREAVDRLRIVGVGVKFNLMNSADQNEGYWEAARFNTNNEDYVLQDATSGRVRYSQLSLNPLTPGVVPSMELSNEPSYQRGKLRDIHRYMFRLNSNNTEHNLGKLSAATPTVPQLVDEDWDMIVIKIHGRVESGSPSVLNYEIVNNQEVVYRPGTAIARLMTPSPFIPQTSEIMGKIKIGMPALQIE